MDMTGNEVEFRKDLSILDEKSLVVVDKMNELRDPLAMAWNNNSYLEFIKLLFLTLIFHPLICLSTTLHAYFSDLSLVSFCSFGRILKFFQNAVSFDCAQYSLATDCKEQCCSSSVLLLTLFITAVIANTIMENSFVTRVDLSWKVNNALLLSPSLLFVNRVWDVGLGKEEECDFHTSLISQYAHCVFLRESFHSQQPHLSSSRTNYAREQKHSGQVTSGKVFYSLEQDYLKLCCKIYSKVMDFICWKDKIS